MQLLRQLTIYALLVNVAFSFSLLNWQVAEVIYCNGDILTMKGEKPEYVQALSVAKGKILHAGTMLEALRYNSSSTKLYNLRGKTLLPGFVDPHSHVGSVGYVVTLCNLFPQPDGNVSSFAHLLGAMQDWQSKNQHIIEQVGWVIGFGYDDSMLTQKRHPDKHLLDNISEDKPVIILHQSFHLGSINTAALKMLNITEETLDPDGGHYRRYPDSTEPTGILEQNALFQILDKINLNAVREAMILDSQKVYAKYGYTTAQDGRTDKPCVELFIKLAKQKKLLIDINSYPDYKSNRDSYIDWKPYVSSTYNNKFRIGGGKLALDGSIQGKTGWLKEHYLVPPQNKPVNYTGYPIFANQIQLNSLVQEMYDRKIQILAHVNGDAAIDQFISAVALSKRNSKPITKGGFSNLDNLRTVSIHSQMATIENLNKMMSLKIIPSFFGEHTFYWGDWHRDETIGPERAVHISPAASARSKKMLFTQHTDSPVVIPSVMRMIWAVVNRVTRSWKVLGPDERIDPYAALLTVTRYSAIQAFEEKTKGTLEKYKLADLVILDSNPLKVAPETISSILVLETIKQGKTIFRYGFSEQQ